MGGPLQALGFNPQVFIAQVVLFIVLVFVMKALLFDPLTGHMEKREQSVKDAYKTVESTRQEMERLRADYQSDRKSVV